MTSSRPSTSASGRASRRAARLDHLYEGCRWAEGPAYFPAHRALVWSDIPNDRMLRYDEATGDVGVFRAPAGYTNGHTVDSQGRLVSCEHGNRRVTRTEHDGTITVLADRFEGKRLNSPNDVVVRSDGAVYFTDPATGSRATTRATRASSEFERLLRLPDRPDHGRAEIVADDFDRPNGLAFSARRAAAVRRRQRRAAATCACSTSPTTAP